MAERHRESQGVLWLTERERAVVRAVLMCVPGDRRDIQADLAPYRAHQTRFSPTDGYL